MAVLIVTRLVGYFEVSLNVPELTMMKPSIQLSNQLLYGQFSLLRSLKLDPFISLTSRTLFSMELCQRWSTALSLPGLLIQLTQTLFAASTSLFMV